MEDLTTVDDEKSVYYSCLDFTELEPNSNSVNLKTEFQVESPIDQHETENTQNDRIEDITKMILILQLTSIIFYLVDVISDHVLAIRYFLNREWTYGAVTLAFVVMPSIYITYRGQFWRGKKNRTAKDRVLFVFILLFNLEPVVQYYQNYKIVSQFLKAKEDENEEDQQKFYEMLLTRKRDVAQLRYWEGVMEAIPQLILQMNILLSNYETLQPGSTLNLQIISLSTSSLGLALTFFNYGKTWVVLKGIKMSVFAHILRCMRWFLPMISRVLAIAVLSSVHLVYMAAVLGVHLLGAIIWRYKTHINQGWPVVLVQSFIDTIIARDDTFFFVIISNVILFIEDIIMLAVWAFTVDTEVKILRIPIICVSVIMGFIGRILHIINKRTLYKYERKTKT